MKMQLPQTTDKPLRFERINLPMKPCQFPGCKGQFHGRGYSKYCDEHRKKEYRKVIDKMNRKPAVKYNNNQRISHERSEITTEIFKCALCGEEFTVKIYPNTFVYPKYCEEHRNEYRRLQWQKTHYVPVAEPPPVYESKEKTEAVLIIPEDTIPCEETIEDYDDDLEIGLFEEVLEETK